ncbi:MAG TPA: 2-amino-4-hydroxy-6-hydroxymethyldihydropteridine diphosphokinase [Gemmatimonadales bacterium]|nr:2-amino-4-hydroxy-6-hydroxymethyldihydropteridine diphosphokinase [Gemmatimonadales bacterium]
MPSKAEQEPSGERAYIALGSNIGDRTAHLHRAREALASLPGTKLLAASSIEETAPLAGMQQPSYLNQMVLLETTLEPRELLRACQDIEQQEGRERRERWGPRTLDLDIVKFGTRRVNDRDLIIPHPELSHRDFWQRELAELKSHER